MAIVRDHRLSDKSRPHCSSYVRRKLAGAKTLLRNTLYSLKISETILLHIDRREMNKKSNQSSDS